jgi:two-component system, OmpR family, sensor histidine kinase SenX3
MDVPTAAAVLALAVCGAALIIVWRRYVAARAVELTVARRIGSHARGDDLVRDLEGALVEAENQREISEVRRAALEFDSTGIIFLTDRGEVVYANPIAEGQTSGSGESAVLRNRVVALAHRVSSTHQTEVMEVDVHDPDRRVLSLRGVPSVGGEANGVVIVFVEDLSERRRIDAMRTDFVANASHELKTPLGALALLAETLAGADDEEQRVRLAQRLQSEAARMASVVNDILQLAETESLGIEYVDVSIGDILSEAVMSLERRAMEVGVTMTIGEVDDANVAADRKQLMSAVRNLLDNAITYTSVKGESGVVRSRIYRKGANVCVEVEDTGIGIPDRYVDRVFERFFRVDRARSRDSGGTGLGLSIVRNVAKAHGGTVTVRSKVGIGSTFTISLPIAGEGAPS